MYYKEYDLKHVKDRLYVHWDITTKCQFKCSYCYAIRQYGENWDKNDKFTNQLLVINALAKAKLPVFLGLLGGEPTLNPYFFKLIDQIKEKVLTKDLSRLYITTNGLSNKITKIEYNSKIRLLWSFHLEYSQCFERIFKHLETCIDKGFKNRVNLLLLPDPKYYPLIKETFNRLSKLNCEVHPHFLYNGENEETTLYDYNNDFFTELKVLDNTTKNFVFENETGKHYFNDYEIFRKKLNCFKGWSCYNNNYEISYDGKVNNICKKQISDLKKNPLFFYKINEIKPFICPYQQCDCDGLLKILKINGHSI